MIKKILIVDDSAPDRMIIKSMLKEYEVIAACDGAEALAKIDEDPEINLMILDLNMPVMDGFQVLEALRDNPEYQRVRTIILTNYDELDNEIRGLKLGAVDYIRKPINMESLRARIDVHVELLNAQQLMEKELYDQGLTFDTVFTQAPIGIAIAHNMEPSDVGLNTSIRINPMFEVITGYSQKELVNLGWVAITHPDDIAQDVAYYQELLAGKIQSYAMDKRYIKPDGSVVWVHLVVAPLCLSDQKEYRHISLIQDISKRKQMENELKHNSEHDTSTGLHNRRYLEDLLKKDVKTNGDVKRALIGISLSSLHSLNKIFGFHYTLNLIKSIAVTLNEHVNSTKQLFNLYENKFAFYITGYQDRAELEDFCQSLTSTLKELLMIERVDAGLGVVEINSTNANDVNKLLKCLLISSEKALAIHDDYSFCFFDAKMEEEIVREEEIMRELAMVAVEEGSSELYLQYQPIINLQNDQICCFEALARLKSDQFGQIVPLEFIPLAEETKLIIPIGYQIINQALNFMQKLKNSGHGQIGVSISISAIQLLRSDFTENLYRMIRSREVDPANIILEITESILADNYEEINSILGEIQKSGIQIAIDDFGTGYSSLARERELNINSLKIDKSFIDKLLYLDPKNAITGDIISMAHKLGHWVVAEGVEYEAQKEYLANYGCDRVQGYLFSKPVDEAAALALLDNSIYK